MANEQTMYSDRTKFLTFAFIKIYNIRLTVLPQFCNDVLTECLLFHKWKTVEKPLLAALRRYVQIASLCRAQE